MNETLGPNAILYGSWLLQSTLCLLLGGVASYCWSRRPARGHRLMVLAIVAALAVPIASSYIRQMNWGILAESPDEAAAKLNALELQAYSPSKDEPGSRAWEPVDSGGVGLAYAERNHRSLFLTISQVDLNPMLRSVILPIWLGLSGLILVRLLLSTLFAVRLLVAASPANSDVVARAVEAAAAKLRLEKLPHIQASDAVRCPLIWGWGRRPTLLIPTSLLSDTSVDWESVACHELAHWKRCDQLTSVFSWLFVGILPWHPLAWWAKRRLHELSERACDDWVLACGQSATAYAETLLNLTPQKESALALAAVGTRWSLKARLMHILDGKKHDPGVGRRWSVALVLVTVLIASGIAFAQKRSRTRFHRVQRGPVSVLIRARGAIESAETLDLRSEIPGNYRVLYMADDGTAVRKGELLVELDAGTLREQLVAHAVRVETLRGQLATKQQARSTIGEGDSDALRLRRAELEAEIQALEIELAQEARRLATQSDVVEKSKLHAPMDGVFLQHHSGSRRAGASVIAEGSLVREKQLLAQIINPARLQVRAALAPELAALTRPGHKAVIRVDAFPDKVLSGEVVEIKPLPDSTARPVQGRPQSELILSLHGPHPLQKPGFTVEVEMKVVELSSVIRIPVEAVVHRSNRAFCLVRAGHGVERRDVEIGLSNGTVVEIKSGLKEGDLIAVNPWRVRTERKTADNVSVRRGQPVKPKTAKSSRYVRPQPNGRSGPEADRASATAATSGEPRAASQAQASPNAVTGGMIASTRKRSLSVNFDHQPWADVFEWIADATDLDLQIHELPGGTLDLKLRDARSPAELLDTINALLLAKGYTFVRTQDLLVVVPLEKLDRHMIPLVTPDALDSRGEHEVVRVMFDIDGLVAKDLQTEFAPLLNKFGQIVALPLSNRLEALDTASTLAQIRDLIQELQPKPTAANELRVFRLTYVDAREAALTVKRMLENKQVGDSHEREAVRVEADTRTNSIIVAATPKSLKEITELLESIDRSDKKH